MHKYNSNDGIEYESEDDGIEKDYKYNEDKCNNKDNDDDDSDNDDDNDND